MVKNVRYAKNFIASCLGLFLANLVQFTFEMCTTAKNWKKNTHILYFGGSRSFEVVDVATNKKLVTSADKQHVCAYLQPFSC